MTLKIKNNNREHSTKKEALKSISKEEVTRLNAMIPKDLHTRLKIFAAKTEKKESMTQIIIKAINEFLNKNSNE